jgi:O-antigen/teichoic acid export membrane protein
MGFHWIPDWVPGPLNFGVRGAVTRYVARFHMEGNHQESSAVTSSALLIFVLLDPSPFYWLWFSMLFSPLSHFPGLSVCRTSGRHSWRFECCCVTDFGVFGGVLAALHRFDLSNLIEIANSLLSAIVIVLVLSAGKGIISLAIVSLAFAIAVGIAYTMIAFQLYPELKIRLQYCDRAHVKLIFSFSLYGFLLQTSFNLIFYTDAVVIGTFLSAGMVTYFAIAGI